MYADQGVLLVNAAGNDGANIDEYLATRMTTFKTNQKFHLILSPLAQLALLKIH